MLLVERAKVAEEEEEEDEPMKEREVVVGGERRGTLKTRKLLAKVVGGKEDRYKRWHHDDSRWPYRKRETRLDPVPTRSLVRK